MEVLTQIAMKRKITQQLIDWKNRPDHKPLILRGARQVGKTYIPERTSALPMISSRSPFMQYSASKPEKMPQSRFVNGEIKRKTSRAYGG